jgi:hypothetical protein
MHRCPTPLLERLHIILTNLDRLPPVEFKAGLHTAVLSNSRHRRPTTVRRLHPSPPSGTRAGDGVCPRVCGRAGGGWSRRGLEGGEGAEEDVASESGVARLEDERRPEPHRCVPAPPCRTPPRTRPPSESTPPVGRHTLSAAPARRQPSAQPRSLPPHPFLFHPLPHCTVGGASCMPSGLQRGGGRGDVPASIPPLRSRRRSSACHTSL